jgi:TetR/AcrR family transcriptional regulator, mexJK operon transcriptional repressor
MAVGAAPTSPRVSRGRIDKRSAILDGAFTVFARRGYADAGVQEIADEAGVAKPTVYNHLTDKETLYREAVTSVAEVVTAENLAVVERLRAAGATLTDLEKALLDVALGLQRICCGPRSRALRFLTYGQVARFPDLVDVVVGRTSGQVSDALADRFAQLVLAGVLRRCDPTVAAEQFLVLVTGPMEARTRLGTRKVAVAEMRVVAADAVDTFLRAYRPDEDTPVQ